MHASHNTQKSSEFNESKARDRASAFLGVTVKGSSVEARLGWFQQGKPRLRLLQRHGTEGGCDRCNGMSPGVCGLSL